MILSVSRRTDIPAFYTDWFFNRLDEGYVLVRNPMNSHQVGKVILSPSVIDCIVFWTKDPAPMLNKLSLLSDYKYYFQVTINAYDKKIERNVPSKHSVIEAFIKLSNMIGKEKVIWRYDPIILTDKTNMEYHFKYFDLLASKLERYTNRCVISFVDFYQKSKRNMSHITMHPIDDLTMMAIGSKLVEIAHKHSINIETCSEEVDLLSPGIKQSKCIDDGLISEIIGKRIRVEKDKNQRDTCGCVESIDIGAYNSCKHGCLYCYANFSDTTVKNNTLKHDPKSPLLIGEIRPEDTIIDKKMKSYLRYQSVPSKSKVYLVRTDNRKEGVKRCLAQEQNMGYSYER